MEFIEKEEALKKLDKLIREPIIDPDVCNFNRGVYASMIAISDIASDENCEKFVEISERAYNAGWDAGRKRLIEQIEEKAWIIRKERKRK